jgi:uncharacterized protein YndB with AHSA1/START domain
MPATADPSTVEQEVHVDAPPEVVFPYFTDPELLCRWQGTEATLEARAGGEYLVQLGPGNVVRGEFVEVDAPHRVVFTWGWEGEDHPVPPGSTRVEVDLRPDGGGTIVRLRHSGLEGVWTERHAVGWTHVLDRFVIVMAGGDPGPFDIGQ